MKSLIVAMNLALNWVLGAIGYFVFELCLSGKLLPGFGDMLLTAFLVGVAASAILTYGLRLRYLSAKGPDYIVGLYSLALVAIVVVTLIQANL